ncbi:MAG: DinB family protein [Candidatus Kariarchaeaceae archaeon]|jgi:uncharacterized damage-inducible protein DinB
MTTSSTNNLTNELLQTCQYFLVDQFLPRIHKCLEALPESDVWLKPNDNTPSVGNLLLHLAGNVHQWIIATLGGDEDIRDRDSEFNEASQPPKSELYNRISTVIHQAEGVLKNLDKDDLLQNYKVQAYEETGLHILIHIVEHFSYHVGQITHFVKARKDIDTGYFSGHNLNQTN